MQQDALAMPIIILTPEVPLNRLVLSAAKAGALAGWEQEPWPGRRKTVRLKSSKTPASKFLELGFKGDEIAVAGEPVPYSEYSTPVRRAQVSGWDSRVLPQEPYTPGTGGELSVLLNAGLLMSPGKMCAQAAHALEAALITRVITPEELDSIRFGWFTEEDTVTPLISVRDGGHTEVPSGSLTAILL